MKIIPIEKKLAVVLSIKDGTPIKVASRNHGVQSKQARAWYRRYTRYGCSGLETKTGSRRFDADFKLHVVLSVLEKSVSLAKAAVIYDIDVNTLRRWREQYLSGKEMPQPASCTKKSSQWEDRERSSHRRNWKCCKQKTNASVPKLHY